MNIRNIAVLLLLLSLNGFSQSVVLFPSELNVKPFIANFLEPRMGFSFQMGENDLRLDIGNSRDLVKFRMDEETDIAIGADFFTYTKLRGETDFHFPVDAVDYLFGVNATYKKLRNDVEYGFRFRLSHISAHMVDGHYDHGSQSWRDNREPIVYSREFLELIPYAKSGGLRGYVGITYLFHVTPEEIGAMNYQAGMELFLGDTDKGRALPYFAYDLRIEDLDGYEMNHSFCAGIKFGYAYGPGLSVQFLYYSGNSIHGEYYDVDEEYLSLGFNVDL